MIRPLVIRDAARPAILQRWPGLIRENADFPKLARRLRSDGSWPRSPGDLRIRESRLKWSGGGSGMSQRGRPTSIPTRFPPCRIHPQGAEDAGTVAMTCREQEAAITMSSIAMHAAQESVTRRACGEQYQRAIQLFRKPRGGYAGKCEINRHCRAILARFATVTRTANEPLSPPDIHNAQHKPYQGALPGKKGPGIWGPTGGAVLTSYAAIHPARPDLDRANM